MKNAVQCGLCPRRCKIPDGEAGICGVRRNRGGALVVESFGRVTALALDPIEKKPLRRFRPGSAILSVGSYGCNLRCPFCQNHEISMGSPPYRTVMPEELLQHSLAAGKNGSIGVAFTYNEPLIGYEYVLESTRLLRENGQQTVLVTSGFVCEEPLLELLPHVDAMNIDLKAFREAAYRSLGGGLEPVKRTIELAARRCHVEVTSLIVPGLNDSAVEMGEQARWLASVDRNIPLHVSRFFPRHRMEGESPMPVETVYRLAEAARAHLRYVYTGNC